MDWLRRWITAWRQPRLDAELREEIETHRALREAQLQRAGLSPEAAGRASRRALGNVTLAREDVRELRIARWLESLWQDVRFSARTFARRPLVWSVAVLSLAFGIGLNTAVFTVFHHLLLRRLPVAAPDELVLVTSPGPKPGSRSTSGAGGMEAIFSYPLFRDVEDLAGADTGVSGMAAHGDFGANLAYEGQPATTGDGLLVSGSYFPLLGIRPALGRLLSSEDDRSPGAHPVAVLSHAYWQRQLGSSPDVLGRTLIVNGHALAIVGVAPDRFTGTANGNGPDVYVPLVMAEAMRPAWHGLDARDDHWLYAFGRLAPGMTRQQAESRLNVPFSSVLRERDFVALQQELGDETRPEYLARRIVLEDGARPRSTSRREARTVLLLIFAITGFVLLIACANVANLLLTRAADREAEIALRLSLGASPVRLMRWLLTEACLLGLAGAASALVVARLGLDVLVALGPSDDGSIPAFALGAPIWLFSASLGVGTGLLFGVFPAVHAVRATAAAGLRAQTGRTTGSPTVVRVRSALATTQTALATALLALAGLCLVSVSSLTRVDLGLDRSGLIVFGVSPYLSGYTPEQTRALIDQIEDGLRAMPAVRSVSTTTIPLLSGWDSSQNLTVEGFEGGPGVDTQARRASIGPDYFRTLGIPLRAGREFTRADAGEAPAVAIVNEAFARKFNLGTRVIGTRIALGQGTNTRPNIEIVGLVGDAAYSQVREAPPPQFFLPNRQADAGALTHFFYARAASDPQPLVLAIRPLVQRLAPNLPVVELRTMEEQIADEMRGDRLVATLTSAFAGLATLLAGIGLYAVLAYGVARRWREIGIRLALGATSGSIRRTVLTQIARITAVGVVLGGATAVAIGRLGQTLLFGLDGALPRVLLGASAVITLVTLAAAIVPVRRAVSVNPVEALRTE